MSRKLTMPLVLLCLLAVDKAQALDIRFSVKVFTSSTGVLPSNYDEAGIIDDFERANALLAGNRSELRYVLEEIVLLDNTSHPGQSQYFNTVWSGTNFSDPDPTDDKPGPYDNWEYLRLHAEPSENGGTAQFEWRTDAFNVYLNQGSLGGGCRHPDFMFMNAGGGALIHETGHGLSLKHIHQGSQRSEPCGPVCDGAGDDLCDDTLIDCWARAVSEVDCPGTGGLPEILWSLDNIAIANYETLYAWLLPEQKVIVDRTYYNPMRGTHDPWPDPAPAPEYGLLDSEWKFITKDQRDHMSSRAYEANSVDPGDGGCSYFVQYPIYVDDDAALWFPFGTFDHPYASLSLALSDSHISDGNAEIILEQGTYSLNGSLTAKVKITSRTGAAHILPD